MYRFSRSIYRELAPAVVEDELDPTGCRNKQQVLDACEGTIRRLTYDRRYFATSGALRCSTRCGRTSRSATSCASGGDRAQHQAGARVPRALARGRRARRRWPRVPRAHAQGHAVPARAAAGQRLLPVAQAPRGSSRAWRAGDRAREAGGYAPRLKGTAACGQGRDTALVDEAPASGSPGPLGSRRAARSRRRRDLHRRGAVRRARAAHGEGADHPRRPVARRARRGRGGARASRGRAPARSRRSPTG